MRIMENNEDLEIDLLRLGRFVLSKWIIIIFSGVLFALLAFSYKYFAFKYSSVPLAELDKQFEIEIVEEQLDGRKQKVKKKVNYNIYKADYDAKMADYNAKYSAYEINKKVAADKVGQAKLNLDLQKEYLENSKLYNISDDDKLYETIVFYAIHDLSTSTITSTSTSTSNRQHPAVTMAVGLLTSNEFITKLRGKLDMDNLTNDKLVKELVNVRVKDLDSFEVVFRADSKELLELLLSETEFINDALKEFCRSYCDFSKIKLSSGSGNPYVLKLLKLKEKESMYELEKLFAAALKNEKNVIEPIKFEDFGKLKDLEMFKIFKYIKFILIGFVFGVFLPICFYVLRYLLDNRLKDENYITNVFGINKISCIHSRDGVKADDRAIKTIESNLDYIICKGAKSVSFVSSLCGVNEQKLIEFSSLVDKFNTKGVSVKLVSPSAIKEIDASDVLIIVEKLDVSDLNDVVDEVKNIQTVKEKIYGIVYA